MPRGIFKREMRLCSVDGCKRKHAAQGFCAMHYERMRNHGNVGIAESMRDLYTSCKMPNCTNKHLAKGLCSSHYVKRYTSIAPTLESCCKVSGCYIQKYANDLCHAHHELFRRTGSVVYARDRKSALPLLSEISTQQLSYTPNLDNFELSKTVKMVLNSLTEREWMVISMRYGLNGYSELTLEEAGQELSVTSERIRQIEAKALRKLRHPNRSNFLKPFVSGEEIPPRPHLQDVGNEEGTDGSYHPTCRVNQGSEGTLEMGQR